MQNERGVAMVMALIVMMILTTLMVGFAVLATSEPQISSNQALSAQARALAESGVSRVVWALNAGQSGTPPTGALVLDASYNLPSPLPSPYDGSTTVPLGVGSFKMTVANGNQINQKLVTAIGYVPNATKPIAIKKIQVTVTRFKWMDPLCGLCAGGEQPPGTATNVQVGGSAAVNASTSSQGQGGTYVAAGAYCSGVTPTAAVASTGTVDTNGTPNLIAPPQGSGSLNGATFPSSMLLSDSDIATLKVRAMASGTYWKGNPPWNGGLPPSNGLIFVDTVDGSVLLTNSTPAANIPSVSIHSDGTWNGWLVVAGSIDISGNVTMSGLIYAQNDVSLHGTGGGSIQGAVITTNRVDTSSTTIDSQDIGNAPVSYNCPKVRDGGGTISQNWFLMPSTYREVPGS